MSPEVKALAERLGQARRITVFSGAGISTESGIPDFRGPNGVWKTVDPREFEIDRFLSSPQARQRYWLRSTEMYQAILKARPNPAHHAVTRLHLMGRLNAVLTQNVDGLHQRAETPAERVVELHGSTLHVSCLSCGARMPREAFQHRVSDSGEAPACDACGGLMKPATISFGQMLDPQSLERAADAVNACDLFLVVGSSLVVYPAAGLPLQAAQRGVPVVILNHEPTPHDDYAALVLHGTAGPVLSAAVDALEARMS